MLVNIEEKAARIEAPFGYVFTNKRLCAEAVQMAAPQITTTYGGTRIFLDNNKRLAVLGDAVLIQALCTAWYAARDQRGEW